MTCMISEVFLITGGPEKQAHRHQEVREFGKRAHDPTSETQAPVLVCRMVLGDTDLFSPLLRGSRSTEECSTLQKMT